MRWCWCLSHHVAARAISVVQAVQFSLRTLIQYAALSPEISDTEGQT